MKMAIITFILAFFQSGVSTKDARNAYFRSADSTDAALKFEKLLEVVNDKDIPVLLCYKGAAEILGAKNTVNLIAKYNYFKRGKTLIEKGLSKDSASVESRFVRYSIQRNLPAFLGYHQNMIRDSVFIVSALPALNDEDLKTKITDYFNRLQFSRK